MASSAHRYLLLKLLIKYRNYSQFCLHNVKQTFGMISWCNNRIYFSNRILMLKWTLFNSILYLSYYVNVRLWPKILFPISRVHLRYTSIANTNTRMSNANFDLVKQYRLENLFYSCWTNFNRVESNSIWSARLFELKSTRFAPLDSLAIARTNYWFPWTNTTDAINQRFKTVFMCDVRVYVCMWYVVIRKSLDQQIYISWHSLTNTHSN